MGSLYRSRDRGGGEPNGQVVSIKRAADGRRQRSREIIDEERKIQGQERILGEHLERTDFCDFENPRKRAYHKGKIESTSKARKEASRNKSAKKGGVPDRVESFGEVDSSKNRPRARHGFAEWTEKDREDVL